MDRAAESARRTVRPRREEYYNPEPRERSIRRPQESPDIPVRQTGEERQVRRAPRKKEDDLDIIDL